MCEKLMNVKMEHLSSHSSSAPLTKAVSSHFFLPDSCLYWIQKLKLIYSNFSVV